MESRRDIIMVDQNGLTPEVSPRPSELPRTPEPAPKGRFEIRGRAPFIGAERGSEIHDKIIRLVGKNIETNGQTQFRAESKDIIERLYSILSVLDAKANGLLRVDSFFITIIVFFLGWANNNSLSFPRTWTVFKPIAYADMVVLLLSSLFCMLVVHVKWKFLGYVTADGDFSAEIKNLCKVVDDRTRYYWLAWWATLLALLGSPLWVVIIMVSRWAKASDFLT